MEVINMDNVSKIINKETVLNNINIRFHDNTIYGLIGKNGAGKTTLLKMILGLYKTSKGKIYINGKAQDKHLEYCLKNIGAVVDTPNLYEYLTGRRNLEFFNLLGKNIKRKGIERIINNLNMSSYIDRPVSTYSLGMKQRLSLGVCLLTTPKVLILDEPLNGLDPNGIKELRKLLIYLKDKYKMSIIISSHILKELESVCDKVVFIKSKTIDKVIDLKESKERLEDIYFDKSN